MTPNVGGIDRGIRLVAGTVLLVLAAMLDGDVRWYGLVGIVPVASALFRYSALYALLGVSTVAAAESTHGGRSAVTAQ